MKRKREKKTKIIFLSVLVILLVISFILVSMFFFHVGNEDVVASVDEYEITAQELKAHMSWNKPYVVEHFQKEDGIEAGKNFWNQKYHGTTPNAYLREYALEELTRYKVEQQLAVSYGMIEKKDTSYSMFLQQLAKENRSRADKIARGEVVYGVRKYTESTYFSYLYSNMQLQLQEKMSEEGEPLFVSDAELKKWYDLNKEKRFSCADTIVLDSYSVTLPNGQDAGFDSSQTARFLELQKDLQNGESLEKLKKRYKEAAYQKITIDDQNADRMQKTSQIFYHGAQNLQAGEVSEVLCDKNTIMVLKCISRKKGGFKNYEEYKSGIQKEYTEECYEQYIKKLVKKAKVVKYAKYKKVVMK